MTPEEQKIADEKAAADAAAAAVKATPADEFAAVFETLNQLGDKPPPANLTSAPIEASAETKKAAADEAAATAAAAAAAAQTDEGGTGDDLPETEADKAAREAAEADVAAKAADAAKRQSQQQRTTTQMDDDEILKRLGRLIKEPPAASQQQTQQQREQTYDYSQEEAAFVTEYEKEWPDVAKAEAIKRSVEYKRLTAHIFKEVVSQIQPLAEALGVVLERTQLQDLQQTVDGYDAQLVDNVAEWVKTQPAYLRTAYVHVMQAGTVDEVNDLVTRYRASTGDAKGGQQATTTTQQKPPGTELPAATKQAVTKLAPVSTKRTAPVQPVVKDDFDGAFAEAVKEA